MNLKIILLTTCSALLLPQLFARWVTQDEVTRAATTTLAKPLFQKNFPATTIAAVEHWDGLWCVRLAPQGHLLFAGSTKQHPLLKYTQRNATTPPPNHPEFRIQANMRAQVKALEAATTLATEPTPAEVAWDALLNPQATPTLLSTTTDELPTEEYLTSEAWNPNWSQHEPWNDLCPQLGAEATAASPGFSLYRNRAPVGCAATMYTQIMKYYAWPQRIDAIYANTLTIANSASGKTAYDMRFHGGLPIEWKSLMDDYWTITANKQLNPCYTSESDRLPVARLGLLVDILSNMAFDKAENGGSGTFLTSPLINDWYDFGSVDGKDANAPFTEAQLTEIKEVLAEGMPLPASIPEHIVFINGYAIENGQTYLNINYGWGNLPNDDGSASNSLYLANAATLDAWVLGHAPKVQVQVSPLPKVINTAALPKVMWMVPEYHEEDFKSFTVSATPYSSTETADYTPTMTQLADPTADEGHFDFATLQDETGQSIEALTIKPTLYGEDVYTFPNAFIPSPSTTLSFAINDLLDADTFYDTRVNVQLWNEVDQCWKTIAAFPESDADGDWAVPESITLSLANYAERFCRLRLALSSLNAANEEVGEGSGGEPEPHYALSQLALTNLYKQGTTTSWKIKKATTRAFQLKDLTTTFGSRYRIQVSATMNDAETVAAFGETFTRLTADPVELPLIQTVTRLSGEALDDEVLLKGDLDGRAGLRVTCNDAVTNLRVWSSCPSLIADDDITLYPYDDHVFDVIIDSPQTSPALDGSRLLLTLEARTAQGNVTYRDVVFALRAATPSVEHTILWDLDETALAIPVEWFRSFGLANDSTVLKALATEDADQDGLLNWQEYLCGTSPIDAADKLQITDLCFDDNGVLTEVRYTPAQAAHGTITLEGKAALTDTTWAPANLSTHRFFRLRVTAQ